MYPLNFFKIQRSIEVYIIILCYYIYIKIKLLKHLNSDILLFHIKKRYQDN